MTEKRAKRSKQGHGEGAKPYQQADGRWRSELMIGQNPDGSRIRKRIYGATSAECTKNLRAAKKLFDNGQLVASSSMRFIEWLDLWLDTMPSTKLRPRTMIDYRGKVENYVRPHRAGMKRLDKLQPEDLESIYQEMRDRKPPLSESTIAGLHRVLRRSLNVAIQRKRLSINPAKLMDAPRPAKFKPTVFTTDQVKKLITAALAMDDGARWVFALTLGPRQGEAIGLTWPDIDFEAERITIARELYTLPWKHGCVADDAEPTCGRKRGDGCPQRRGGGFFFDDPKSEAGSRSAIMPDQLTESLKRHRKIQLANRPDDWVPFVDAEGISHDLVFCRSNGKPLSSRSDWAAWKTFCADVGVPAVRTHDARHTAATTLLLLGVSPRVVMEMLGWSQMSMLTRYQHVLDEMKRDAADRISALWSETPTQSNVVSFDELRKKRGK